MGFLSTEIQALLQKQAVSAHCLQKVPDVNQLLELGQPGDWFTTIDLKDTYFHVCPMPLAEEGVG